MSLINDVGLWLSRLADHPFVGPQVIQISLTHRCNLNCAMCGIKQLLPQDEELSTQQVLKVLDEAKDFGIEQAIFTGGEPFLRKDIFDICSHAHKNGIRSVVTTNGIFADEAIFEKIAGSCIDHIHFSVDGLEDTNDYYRGKGSYKTTMKSISILNAKRSKGRFFSVGMASTVMNKNVSELSRIASVADDLNVDVINFQPLIRDNANFMDHSLSPYWLGESDISILKKEISRIREYDFKHTKLYEEPSLELLIKYYEGRLTKKDWVCFGGFKTAFICFSERQPLVYSCHGICGNLEKASLEFLWNSREAHELRLHSKNCKNLCMQSCYSQESAQGLGNMFKKIFIRKGRHG